LFFVPEGEIRADRKLRQRLAKAICAECEVRVECADFALRSEQVFGIWGGMTEIERRDLLSNPRIAVGEPFG
jgi:WhiB family redox-sensing transcriptional regulator